MKFLVEKEAEDTSAVTLDCSACGHGQLAAGHRERAADPGESEHVPGREGDR